MLSNKWHTANKSSGRSCVEAMVWFKAARSNGNGGNNCVEAAFAVPSVSAGGTCVDVACTAGQCVDVGFVTSSFCGSNACVEVGFTTADKSGPNCDNCVEVGFAKAEASTSGACVEIGFADATKSAAAGHCVEVGFATADASLQAANCVEVGFATPETSVNNGTCVEVGTAPTPAAGCGCNDVYVNGVRIPNAKDGDVLLRDTKDNGTGPIFVYAPTQWDTFLTEVLAAGMDWERNNDGFYVVDNPDGSPVTQLFDDGEWDAFLDGVRNGEFSRSAT